MANSWIKVTNKTFVYQAGVKYYVYNTVSGKIYNINKRDICL